MEREHSLACHANIETSGNYCHLSMDTAGMLVKQIQIIIVMRSDLHANLHVDVGRDQLIKLHNLNAIFTSHLKADRMNLSFFPMRTASVGCQNR